MSPTPVSRQTTLVAAPGSNEIQITEGIDANSFEDAFLRATSQVMTGPTLLDIFVQMGTTQKKCTSQVPMMDYVVKLEIFP